MVGGRCTSAGTGSRDRTRGIAIVARKRGSQRPQCRHAMDSILFVKGGLLGPSLRVACRILKKRARLVTKGWGDERRDALLQRMVSETMCSVQRDDPASGDWYVDGQELNVWDDASSLSIEVALERHEIVLEDACPTYQSLRAGRRKRHQFSSLSGRAWCYMRRQILCACTTGYPTPWHVPVV